MQSRLMHLNIIIVILLSVSKSQACETELKNLLDTDLLPRIQSYHSKQKGLDWVPNFQECRSQPNATYVSLIWRSHNYFPATYGFCLPEGCDQLHARQIVSSYAEASKIVALNYSVNFIDFNKPILQKPGKFFFFLSFLILLALTLVSTILQKWISQESVLAFFNATRNFKIFVDVSKPSSNLDILDGIRTLASAGILFLHVHLIQSGIPIENRSLYNAEVNNFENSLILGLILSIDVFFYIAGFLMSYLTVQELQRKGKDFSWALHFIRRVLRYLPVYLFMIGFERNSPVAPPEASSLLIMSFKRLNKTTPWWVAFFFLQNFSEGDTDIYLGWTWSICADFHFFIVSSLIVYFYCKNKTLGYFSAFIFIVLSLLYAGITVYVYDINANSHEFITNQAQMNLLYFHSLARIIPYMVGVMLGFLFLSNMKKNFSVAYSVQDGLGERFEKQCLNLFRYKKIRILLYCLGSILLGICVSSIYYFAQNGDQFIGKELKSIFLGCKWALFTAGFAIFAFSIKLGYLRLLADILKAKIFRWTSKISYSLYLVHPVVISIYLSKKPLLVPSLYFSIVTAAATYFISGIIAIFLHLIVESPFNLLEKRYLAR